MNNLFSMTWIEVRKANRSRMPLWTMLGALFLPFGIAFLIYVARNPEVSKQLGLISAKADLVAYSATDWAAYFNLFGLILAAGGFFLFLLATSWVFGREFADGTLKDLLAVPVPRVSILMAKFIAIAAWCVVLSLVIILAGFGAGVLIGLPGGSISVYVNGFLKAMATAALVILVIPPFAFFASVGRGYLLPIGLGILAVVMANLVALTGWGEYFPWAIPGLYAQGESALLAASYWIVAFTCLVGIIATLVWWKYADQSR